MSERNSRRKDSLSDAEPAPNTIRDSDVAPSRVRILGILNGSLGGFSGGDFHTTAILSEWAANNDVELYLPRGSSPELLALLSSRVKARRNPAQQRLSPKLRDWIGRSRLRYIVLAAWRLLSASAYVLIHRQKWDVVVASSHFGFDTVPVFLAPSVKRRALYFWHHLTPSQERPAWVSKLVHIYEEGLTRAIARRGVRVIAGNALTKAWLEERGVPGYTITLTANGPSYQAPLEYGDWFERNPTFKRLTDRRFALFFSRITNMKGAADLPVICQRVLAAEPDVIIVFCGGETDDAVPVHRALDSLQRTGAVVFMGFVSGPAKTWLFQNAHVVIAPSYEEGWGITVSDGLLSGCWVVTYELPAVREAFPQGPIYVPLGDAQGFADATIACLKKARPPRLGGDQERFSWSRIANDELRAILKPVPSENRE